MRTKAERAAYNRQWHKDHPNYARDWQRKNGKRYADRARALIQEHKVGPCVDCGGDFPQVCYDFDHRDPMQKHPSLRGKLGHTSVRRNMNYLARTSATQFLDEIKKCDVVCANCHRIRTARQRANKVF